MDEKMQENREGAPEVAEETLAEQEKAEPDKAEPATEAASERTPEEKRSDRIFLILLFILIAGYTALFATLSVLRYTNYRTPGVDLGIFNQVIWLLSHGRGATSTIRGMNLFGDHFAPILFLLAPIYWIRGNVQLLLVIQTIALALGALPLYLIARRKLDNRGIALVVAGAYLLYPAMQQMNLFDFHPETLALLFLLLAVLAVTRRRFLWFYVCCLLAIICKEDIALAVLLLGLVVYFKYDRRAGGIVTIGSAVYFVGAVFIAIPRLGPEGFQYTGRLRQFGTSTSQALWNMLRHPGHTADVIATRTNLKYIFDLLMPVAFLAILAPVFLLPALPAFVINILSDFSPQHTINYQYTAAIIPFVFVAVIFALAKFRGWAAGALKPRLVAGTLAFVLLACALAGNFYFGPSPISEAWQTANYRGDAHVQTLREAVALIPPDASVSSQTFLLPHLSSRAKIYMFPQPLIDFVDRSYYNSLDVEQRKFMWPGIYRRLEKGANKALYPVPPVRFVALDRSATPWPLTKSEYDKMISRLLGRGGFKAVFDRDAVLILERRSAK